MNNPTITPAEITRFGDCALAFGLLLRYLRQSNQTMPASIAAGVAQGRITAPDAVTQFEGLLQVGSENV
jgi:hypothetical protein